MAATSIKQLLEAGVHFGHQTHRWNPKMKKYIFGERNGIYIINLEITLGCIEKALAFLKQVAQDGKEVLFVGTKKQAQDAIKTGAEQCGMPYVNQRWLGGMLTNFETIKKSIKKLEEIENMEAEGNFQFVTKKEANELKKEREKLDKNLGGIRNMKKAPGAIFVIDSKVEEIAIREADKLGIPIVGILDTNCNPDLINYPIPGNDDAIRAVKLFCDLTSKAVSEGRQQFQKFVDEQEARRKEEEAQEAAKNQDDVATKEGESEEVKPEINSPAEEAKLAANVAENSGGSDTPKTEESSKPAK